METPDLPKDQLQQSFDKLDGLIDLLDPCAIIDEDGRDRLSRLFREQIVDIKEAIQQILALKL